MEQQSFNNIVMQKTKMLLEHTSTIAKHPQMVKSSKTEENSPWKKLRNVAIEDLDIFKLKEEAEPPSFKSYLLRLQKHGKFDTEVYIMAAYLFKKVLENSPKDLDLKEYSLKFFSVLVMISHKYVMDVTWRLPDLSKILGFGKNSLQNMEFFIYQLIGFKIHFRDQERLEALDWLENLDESIDLIKEIDLITQSE